MQDGDIPKRAPLQQRSTAFETALMTGGIVLFLALLYEMHTLPVEGRFLTPPLTAAAGVILLWPIRKNQAVKALLLAGGFLLTLWFLDRLSGVLFPFVLVYVLAYLFDPSVSYVRERFGVPRWISSLLVTLVVVGAVALVVLMLAPSLVNQLEDLAARTLLSLGDLRQWLSESTLLDSLEEAGLLEKDALIAEIMAAIQEQASIVAGGIPAIVQGLIGYIGSVLGLITIATIIPVILYYTLKDYPFIKRRLVGLFPTFGGQREYLVKIGSVVGSYLRGQLIISGIAAFNVSVALMLFDVPFALLIGLLGGVLNLIPSLGIIITNVIGILIAITFGDPWLVKALIVFLVLLGESILEQTVLTPKILSTQVGLHPVLILLSLFVFGYFLGLFGLLIAVPVTALLMTFYKSFRHELTLELASGNTAGPNRRLFRRHFLRKPVASAKEEALQPEPEQSMAEQPPPG